MYQLQWNETLNQSIKLLERIRYSKQLDPLWNQPHWPRIKHGQGGDGKRGTHGEMAEHGTVRDASVEHGGPGKCCPRWRLSHGGGGVVPSADGGEQGLGGGEQASSATYTARKSATQVHRRLNTHSRSNVHRGKTASARPPRRRIHGRMGSEEQSSTEQQGILGLKSSST
jgi:hypothetical protein